MPVLDIVPPPPSMWELRIIIYEVDGIMPTDGGMDCSGAHAAEMMSFHMPIATPMCQNYSSFGSRACISDI